MGKLKSANSISKIGLYFLLFISILTLCFISGCVVQATPGQVVSSTLLNINRLTHRYGPILGDTNLINKLKQKYRERDICLDGLDFTITCGANQGFFNIALALCDSNQNSSNIV